MGTGSPFRISRSAGGCRSPGSGRTSATRELLALRLGPNRALHVPAKLTDGSGPRPELRGTLTVLSDGGMNDAEMLRWLFTLDPTRPGDGADRRPGRAPHRSPTQGGAHRALTCAEGGQASRPGRDPRGRPPHTGERGRDRVWDVRTTGWSPPRRGRRAPRETVHPTRARARCGPAVAAPSATSCSTRRSAPVDVGTSRSAATPRRRGRPARAGWPRSRPARRPAASRARAISRVRLPSRRSSPAGFPVSAASPKTPRRSSRSWKTSRVPARMPTGPRAAPDPALRRWPR